MVNRKLKKKTLKKKSKNKTKKKYMNRRDIENLFMMSSFQRGGVDLYGGGLKVLHQFTEPRPEPATHTSPTSSVDPLEEINVASEPQPADVSVPKPEVVPPSEDKLEQWKLLKKQAVEQQKADVGMGEHNGPAFGQETGEDERLAQFRVHIQPQQVEETDCNTLLQELTNMLEDIIRQFNSP